MISWTSDAHISPHPLDCFHGLTTAQWVFLSFYFSTWGSASLWSHVKYLHFDLIEKKQISQLSTVGEYFMSVILLCSNGYPVW